MPGSVFDIQQAPEEYYFTFCPPARWAADLFPGLCAVACSSQGLSMRLYLPIPPQTGLFSVPQFSDAQEDCCH